jgi:hypothetical protein
MRRAVIDGSQAIPEMRLPWIEIQSETSARALAAASSVPAARMWRSQRKPCSDFAHCGLDISSWKGDLPPVSTRWPDSGKRP